MGDFAEPRSCLRRERPSVRPPWRSEASQPPAIRFRGADSLESFHIINQELSPDMRLSRYMSSTTLTDKSVQPRPRRKLPPVRVDEVPEWAQPTALRGGRG